MRHSFVTIKSVGIIVGVLIFPLNALIQPKKEHVALIRRANLSTSASTGTLSEGSPCDSSDSCQKNLACQCLALNRGLQVCMHSDMLLPPKWARKLERQGEICDAELPEGLEVMPPPPVILTGDEIIDPRSATDPALQKWANGPGKSFYSSYIVAKAPGGSSRVGIPILAGNDVPQGKLYNYAQGVRHFLFEAAVENATWPRLLAQSGVRILIAGRQDGAWRKHPEVKKDFATGLGGGAPWFPSTGLTTDEPPEALLEELFHTIQYTAMQPRDVCIYHKAYAQGVASKLYTTDHSGPEVDGEPVPTLQADEYLAMAMHRWFGNGGGENDEYKIHGSSSEPGGPTGRENLRKQDPNAFCTLSSMFRSDDTWNPDSDRKPWKANPNRAMDRKEVAGFCQPILTKLAEGCPSKEVVWPRSKLATFVSLQD